MSVPIAPEVPDPPPATPPAPPSIVPPDHPRAPDVHRPPPIDPEPGHAPVDDPPATPPAPVRTAADDAWHGRCIGDEYARLGGVRRLG